MMDRAPRDDGGGIYAFGREAAPPVAERKARANGGGFVQLERWLGEYDNPGGEQVRAVAIDDPWAATSWREAAIDYHKLRGKRASIVSYTPEEIGRLRRLMDDNISRERAWHELSDIRNRPTPKATIDAVWWAICERGMGALAELPIVDRIANFDEAARSELGRRIANIGV